MSSFTNLVKAINATLASVDVLAGVSMVNEDARNLAAEIARALGKTGTMVFIGVPAFKNRTPQSDTINGDISMDLLVQEVPSIWRDQADTKLHCSDIGKAVAGALQGLFIPGYQPLRVMNGMPVTDKEQNPKFQFYKLVVETTQVFLPATDLPAVFVPPQGAMQSLRFWDAGLGKVVTLTFKNGAPVYSH